MIEQPTPQRPPFQVRGLATVKHLGIRKEGPEDDKIIATDVKLEVKGLDRRLCSYFDDAIEAFLWRGDTDALIVRNDFLSPIGYGNVIGDAIIKIGALEFIGDAKKFFITPRDGGVITLSLSVTLKPTADEVAELAKLVQEDVSVSIESPLDLFSERHPQHGEGREIDLETGEITIAPGVSNLMIRLMRGGAE